MQGPGQNETACDEDSFFSRDLDETRAIVARLFCDHSLRPVGGAPALDYWQQHRRLGAFSFSRMRYGCEVEVEPGSLDDFYLIQMPLAGQDRCSAGGTVACSDARHATLHGPRDHLAMHWSADCEKFVVRIDRGPLERYLQTRLGSGRAPDFAFGNMLALDNGAVRAWIETAQYVFGELCRNPALADEALLSTQFEQLLLNAALSWLPAAAPRDAAGEGRLLLPRHVKQAEEYLRANVDQPLTVETLAERTGVSGRTLYDSFRKFLGVSPMRYLRELRMERARADLLDPAQARSVTEVATRWGFYQLGRFATDYRARYGESPNQTLKKAL